MWQVRILYHTMCLCISPGCPRPQNYGISLFCQACGSELLLEGKYRVIRKMGEGGFGKTFEVSHSNTFKVLKVLILDDVKAVSLFQQEARVLSQLNHPGIPKAYGRRYKEVEQNCGCQKVGKELT